ncbi:hypothetical protein ACFL6H_05985 [Candidatus Latescibacterota bacterium]
MASCPGCRVCLFLGLLFWVAGCGSMFQTEEPFHSEIPKTNSQIAEIVFESALEKAGIPGGRGVEIRFVVENNIIGSDILEMVAPEFLLNHGYIVSEKNGLVPEFRFSVDTLYVNLERAENDAQTIQRYAMANIGAVLTDSGGTKKVFIGSGKYQDSLPFGMMEAVGTHETYVHRFPSQEHIREKFQPVLLGITMTALVWLLYSYRG